MAYNLRGNWRNGARGNFSTPFPRRDSPRPTNNNTSKIQLRESRKKLCPRSPFWSFDFDKAQHTREYRLQLRDEARAKAVYNADWLDAGKHGTWTIAPITRAPFHGNQQFDSSPSASHESRSAVLSIPTIFCEDWELAKEATGMDIAPWPTNTEMEYEGDGRIATDKLHGRFLGVPRVEGGGGGGQWAANAVIPQYGTDERYRVPQACEVLLRQLWVEELEFEDGETGEIGVEGRFALGRELMRAMEGEGGYKF